MALRSLVAQPGTRGGQQDNRPVDIIARQQLARTVVQVEPGREEALLFANQEWVTDHLSECKGRPERRNWKAAASRRRSRDSCCSRPDDIDCHDCILGGVSAGTSWKAITHNRVLHRTKPHFALAAPVCGCVC